MKGRAEEGISEGAKEGFMTEEGKTEATNGGCGTKERRKHGSAEGRSEERKEAEKRKQAEKEARHKQSRTGTKNIVQPGGRARLWARGSLTCRLSSDFC